MSERKAAKHRTFNTRLPHVILFASHVFRKKYFKLLQVTVKAELKFPCKAAKRVESVVVDGGELPFRMQSDEGGLRT